MHAKEIRFGGNISKLIFFQTRLNSLGIEKKYTGYYYLVELMDILINENKRIRSFSKEVYPRIAEKYSTTPWTIERNIRSVIDKSWSLDLMQKLNYYRPENDKPTCREFVYLIKNYIIKDII